MDLPSFNVYQSDSHFATSGKPAGMGVGNNDNFKEEDHQNWRANSMQKENLTTLDGLRIGVSEVDVL